MISYAWPAFVEISLGEGAGVFAEVRMVTPGDPGEYLVIVTNDRAQPISFEAEFETGAGEVLAWALIACLYGTDGPYGR